jgi:hypothetical protein
LKNNTAIYYFGQKIQIFEYLSNFCHESRRLKLSSKTF